MMPQLTNDQWQPIDAEIYAGRKIQAIKLYREVANLDLAAAKIAVESRESDLRRSNPSSFAAKSGCMSLVVVVATAAIALYKLYC